MMGKTKASFLKIFKTVFSFRLKNEALQTKDRQECKQLVWKFSDCEFRYMNLSLFLQTTPKEQINE